MAANKTICLSPQLLTMTPTTNIWNPPTITGGTSPPENCGYTYYIIRHIRVTNRTQASAKVALWKGLTGANTLGTECIFAGQVSAGAISQGVSVPANSYLDWYGALRLDSRDTNQYIVGGSDTSSALTIEAEGEMGVS